jgi:hypothetical protein
VIVTCGLAANRVLVRCCGLSGGWCHHGGVTVSRLEQGNGLVEPKQVGCPVRLAAGSVSMRAVLAYLSQSWRTGTTIRCRQVAGIGGAS